MNGPISRRRTLGALATTLALATLPYHRIPQLGAGVWTRLRDALVAACGSHTVAESLGQTCVAQGVPALTRNAAELAASYERASAAGIDFASWFDAETRLDFDAGRVVRVDGWVISETEFLLFVSGATPA